MLDGFELRIDGRFVAVPASVQRLLKSCLEKDPKRRLRDIGEARLALEGASILSPPRIVYAARTPLGFS